MIDIHSHLLPGIDDGAKDLGTSLAMAKQYVQEGFSHVIVTPHWIEHTGTGLLEKTRPALEKLQLSLVEQGIPLKLFLGNEFFITPHLSKSIQEGLGASMAESRYVLVEFPMNEYPFYVDHALHELQLKKFTPIIAHPERYHYVAKDPNMVGEWIKKGMLIQVNLPSVGKLYGSDVQNTAKILLAHNMVHFLASDSHSDNRRSPHIMRAVRKSGLLGEEEIHRYLQRNPGRILRNEALEVEEPKVYKKRKWFLF